MSNVRFVHESFRDYLCAERLKTSLTNWTKPGQDGQEFEITEDGVEWEIYDLLGYGGLTKEIVDYLMALLKENAQFGWKQLFDRLEGFYIRWCKEDIDRRLPRSKQEQLERYGIQLDKNKVNVYAVLNVMILLWEIHRYAHSENAPQELSEEIAFYPCGKNWDIKFKSGQMKNKIISKCNGAFAGDRDAFARIVGQFLSGVRLSEANLSDQIFAGADLTQANLIDANLKGANLNGANLTEAYLNSADLSDATLVKIEESNIQARLIDANLCAAKLMNAQLMNADLSRAYLGGANLRDADLSHAHLSNAILCSADLSEANLSYADLSNANLMGAEVSGANFRNANLQGVNIEGVRGLETAENFDTVLR